MKQEVIMKFDKYRYTIDHTVDGRDFEFELDPVNPGFCAGMAGMDFHAVNVVISEVQSGKVGRRIGSFFLKFPTSKTGEQPHPRRMLEREALFFKGQPQPAVPPPRCFTSFAQAQIVKAVEWFLRAQASDIAHTCQLDHVSLMVK